MTVTEQTTHQYLSADAAAHLIHNATADSLFEVRDVGGYEALAAQP